MGPASPSTTSFCDHPALRRYWYAVARSVDLTRDPAAVTLLGGAYVLWRDEDGAVVAAPDRCPHREAPLSLGRLVGGHLECAYHGWRFGTGGRCVFVPSANEGVPVPPKAHLPTIHAAERYGLVWMCPGEPAAGIPDIPYDADPAYRRLNVDIERWQASATRMTDNFLDISHFPFVHTGTFGRAQDTHVPKIDLGPLEDGYFGYRYEVEVNNDALGASASGLAAKVLTRRMTTGFHLPFTVRSTIHYETGLDHILLLLSTPVDDVTSLFTFVVWRNDDFTVPTDEVLRFDKAIGDEDRRMLERVPGVLPMDATALVSVQADKASVEWRRRLVGLLEGEVLPAAGPAAIG
ncbi:MAG TPA: aromatic ring-hydroxylating dioxygenase subunit alpha [Acidimicrobiales bacterium]